MDGFPQRLKQLRTIRKVTQKELADYLHVSQNAVFNWENGKREPSIDVIKKIADYFGVSYSSMMGWKMCYPIGNGFDSGILPQPLNLDHTIQDEELNAHRGHLLFPDQPELAELHDAAHYQMAQWLKELKEYREQAVRREV